MTDIYSLTYEQAEKLLTENGFRATQCVNISVTYISAERQVSTK